jgi:glycosyltransferase involved in cell wall biosynthesis
MKVLLVGNYELDGSTSMHIWVRAIERELTQLGINVRVVAPRPVLGRLNPSSSGLGKWLGYLDRYLIFPKALRAAAAEADLVHICDHGSAMYCPMLSKPTVVTCHDMLAVRGALGEVPEMRASWFGRYLQSWICKGLRQATRVACISQATYEDASRILGRRDNLRIVLNGLNYPFQHIDDEEAARRLATVTDLTRSFLLHIGSSHPRKNRDGVLRVFAAVAAQSGMAQLQLVFAGEALDRDLLLLADKLEVRAQVVQVINPDVGVVEALYSRALALLFPSRYEGFGWPPIEAQACGCPVVGSDIPPLAQVLTGSAALHRLDDEAGMAASVLKLATDAEYRNRMKQLGLQNVGSRFQTSRMIGGYIAIYKELMCPLS